MARASAVSSSSDKSSAASAATSSTSSLLEPRVARLLNRLHRDARIDMFRIARVLPFVGPDFLGFRKANDDRLSHHMRSTYLPVSRSQGNMLYLLARSIEARRIVEFGTSFGISTIYLAAAVKDNGGGVVVGSELEPSKHAKAEDQLREAGLEAVTQVRALDLRGLGARTNDTHEPSPHPVRAATAHRAQEPRESPHPWLESAGWATR